MSTYKATVHFTEFKYKDELTVDKIEVRSAKK